MKIPDTLFNRVVRPSLFILLLLPACYYSYGYWQETLGANPLEAIIRGLGDWALRILLIILAISPLRRLLNWPQILRTRRMLGLYTYFYTALHLMGYLWFEQFFDWEETWFDIKERPFITIGIVATVLLTPLAITSTKGMIRRLGKNWKRLHFLIYPISIMAIIHFWWMVKLDATEPMIYSVILTILLVERLIRKISTIHYTSS